ncbi:MAG: hypothetical protein JOZ13_07925 [Alphaproteobacteria bacterium]|nr:hypothetical protein [Alphaproteobacteria bacterium]
MIEPAEPAKRRHVGVGIALLVIGLLILIPSGLCTGIFAFGGLVELFMQPGSADSSFLALVLSIGGPFVAAGTAMVYFGVKALRRKD